MGKRDNGQGSGLHPMHGVAQHICLSEEDIGQIHGVEGALKELLKRACTALSASLAVIHLPDKQVTVRVDSNDWPLPNAVRVVRDLQRLLAERTKSAATTEQLALSLSSSFADYAAPIVSESDNFEGALLVARGVGAEEFSTREQNLLDAIAGNIGEIITARFDPLTGLINQREFDSVLDKTIADRQGRNISHSLLHVNLDHLQSIDDSFGCAAADAAIRAAAATLKSVGKSSMVLAHLGNDEFCVLLRDCPADRGLVIGQDIRRAIRDMSIVQGQPLKLTASIGVACLSEAETATSAQAAARIACIVAKDRGRDRVVLYQHQDAAIRHTDATMRVAYSIHEALRDDRFVLYSQPIESLAPVSEPRNYEILLRGLDEDDQVMAPSEFLPQAERNRLMPAIDRWVIRHTLEAVASVRRNPDGGQYYFAINLSGQSLCDGNLLEYIRNEFSRTRVAPELICFEVTETAAILNFNQAIELMSKLRNIGCRFSLDDFGSGLSSFSYLKSLPIDHLKIDGQFVREIVEDPVSNAMVAAINQMSHALGLKTIAEFVENTAIRTQLAGIGVDFGQGYGIERPIPLDAQLEKMAKVRPIKQSGIIRAG